MLLRMAFNRLQAQALWAALVDLQSGRCEAGHNLRNWSSSARIQECEVSEASATPGRPVRPVRSRQFGTWPLHVCTAPFRTFPAAKAFRRERGGQKQTPHSTVHSHLAELPPIAAESEPSEVAPTGQERTTLLCLHCLSAVAWLLSHHRVQGHSGASASQPLTP